MPQKNPVSVLQLSTQSTTAFRFALPLARYLRDRNYNVTIGCSREPQPDVPDYHNEIVEEGFHLLEVPIPRAVELRSDFRSDQAVNKDVARKRF